MGVMTESAGPLSDAEITLAHDPVSPGSARRFVRHFLADQPVECDVDSAQLLVSEVTTNAVLHATGSITLYVAVTEDALRVEVHDASPRMPRQRDHADDATTGRGLDLVSTLAARWGAHTLHSVGEQRKVVWFELPATVTAG
jgi:anti-sigma regulatory factor (Ser/Thr protein kinase)